MPNPVLFGFLAIFKKVIEKVIEHKQQSSLAPSNILNEPFESTGCPCKTSTQTPCNNQKKKIKPSKKR